jgi:hypothetical protein
MLDVHAAAAGHGFWHAHVLQARRKPQLQRVSAGQGAADKQDALVQYVAGWRSHTTWLHLR